MRNRRQIENGDVNGTDIDRSETEGHQEGNWCKSLSQRKTQHLQLFVCVSGIGRVAESAPADVPSPEVVNAIESHVTKRNLTKKIKMTVIRPV